MEFAAGVFFSDYTWEIWPIFFVLSGMGGVVTGVLWPIERWLLGRLVLGYIATFPACLYIMMARRGNHNPLSPAEFALLTLVLGGFVGLAFGAVLDRTRRKEEGDEGEAVREADDDIRLEQIKIYWPDATAESPPGIAPAHLPLIAGCAIARTVDVQKNAEGFAGAYNRKVIDHLRAVERMRSGRVKPVAMLQPPQHSSNEGLRHCLDCRNLFAGRTLICPECGEPTIAGDLPDSPTGK